MRHPYVEWKVQMLARGDDYHENMGKLSGFEPCCRKYFEFRLKHIPHQLYMLHYKLRQWLKWRFGQYKIHKLVPKGKWRHVACPKCHLKWLFRNPVYYRCTTCGWDQFMNPLCNMCGGKGRELPRVK